jgi:hypothetical protein
MPSKTKAQQRLMGIAYSVEKFIKTKGEDGTDPDTLDTDL